MPRKNTSAILLRFRVLKAKIKFNLITSIREIYHILIWMSSMLKKGFKGGVRVCVVSRRAG